MRLATERDAAFFHALLAGVGVLHILAGIAIMVFHGVSARRHLDNEAVLRVARIVV